MITLIFLSRRAEKEISINSHFLASQHIFHSCAFIRETALQSSKKCESYVSKIKQMFDKWGGDKENTDLLNDLISPPFLFDYYGLIITDSDRFHHAQLPKIAFYYNFDKANSWELENEIRKDLLRFFPENKLPTRLFTEGKRKRPDEVFDKTKAEMLQILNSQTISDADLLTLKQFVIKQGKWEEAKITPDNLQFRIPSKVGQKIKGILTINKEEFYIYFETNNFIPNFQKKKNGLSRLVPAKTIQQFLIEFKDIKETEDKRNFFLKYFVKTSSPNSVNFNNTSTAGEISSNKKGRVLTS